MTAAADTSRPSPSGHRERLRDRFTASASSLNDEQRLELLLTFGIPRRDVAPIAGALMRRFGSVRAVLHASQEDLLAIDGIGDHAATLLRLVGDLRERTESPLPEKPRPVTPSAELFVDIVPKSAPTPASLPRSPEPVAPVARVTVVADEPKPSARRARTGLFSACVFRDAMKLVHKIPLGSTIEQAREFLQTQGLHYSGATTRHRYASYIVNRVFPGGEVDESLCRFARAFEGTQALRDAVAYRHMSAEPLTREIIVELLVPAVGRQNVPRAQLRKFLSHRFPGAKPNSINSCGKAIVEIIGESQLVGATRTDLAVHFRPVDLRSFGFILHSEFPEPGMHRLDEMEGSAAFRAMLWTNEDMKTALYELRNKGLISKISEIDSFRQFTTRFSLSQAVEKLIAIGGAR